MTTVITMTTVIPRFASRDLVLRAARERLARVAETSAIKFAQ
jgi:hypothetical protein